MYFSRTALHTRAIGQMLSSANMTKDDGGGRAYTALPEVGRSVLGGLVASKMELTFSLPPIRCMD
jgi:hypothetical protein